MFPQLPETTRNKGIIAAHKVLSECQDWDKYGFIRFWEKRASGMTMDIDTLMMKYECIRDGYSADGEMVSFINSHRELMDRAFSAYEG